MPVDPEARQRLMDLMEERRLELGKTWREVCADAAVSYEAVRNFRNGQGGMRPLTQRKLSVALEWDAGKVGRILSGLPDGGEQPALPGLVSDNWDDATVRYIWRTPGASEGVRLGFVAQYLREQERPDDDDEPASREDAG